MNKSLTIIILLLTSFLYGEEFQTISGDVIRLDDFEKWSSMTCPDLVDSCIYVCDEGISNPCHPENLYAIVVDSSTGDTATLGSRFRIYFPWEYLGMFAEKFTVTASWPCLSPTAVWASGNYAYWDVIGHGACPGTVQGSIWYGEDCEDEEGNIGADHCLELVGRFCFAPGDTLDWPEESDQSISSDTCNACWMSLPAWQYYDEGPHADPLLSPGTCAAYDHCHHNTPEDILCGVGYFDGGTTSISEETHPSRFALRPIYPNPFNPSTTIRFDLPAEGFITLSVYDITGKLVETLINEVLQQGSHNILWQPQNLPSGNYFVQLKSRNRTFTKKLTLLK